MTTYIVLRENFQANTWEPVGQVDAINPERAVRRSVGDPNAAMSPDAPFFGTFVAIPADEFTQFIEGRPRVVISAHVETLEPAGVSDGHSANSVVGD